MTGQDAVALGGWVLSVGTLTGAGAVAGVSAARDAGRMAREVAGEARLCWLAWRSRNALPPADGRELDRDEWAQFAGLLLAWADEAGTERVSVMEIDAEAMAREADW